MAILLRNETASVSKTLRKLGFSCMKSNPTEKQAEEFVQVMIMTGRSDLKFTPYVDLLYEKRLSNVTSLIVEGKAIKNAYRYCFYKARYYLRSGKPSDIKVYVEGANAVELVRLVENYFEKMREEKV